MKLKDLFETPVIVKKEFTPKDPMRPFYSDASLKRDFNIIRKDTTSEGEDYLVALQKNASLAAVGIPGVRSDGKRGIDIIGTVDFKPVNLSGLKTIKTGKHVLQVSLVEVVPKRRTQGWGLYLYTALADAGFVIISDNTQYLGGQKLWKRIAQETLNGRYKVYVIDAGEIRMDKDGDPIVYDSSNIDDSELWSEDSSLKYTLFALKAA